VGRYANRIRNGTFTLNGQTYHIPTNENGGLDTLHGGKVGYDVRNWTTIANNDTAVTFGFLDQVLEGFPGTVYTLVTYAVSTHAGGAEGQIRSRLTASIVSAALDEPTPIMLSTHIFWNLNAFKQKTVLEDTTLWMPYATRYIQTDGILIPNGSIGAVSSQPALDFTSPKTVGYSIDVAQGVCGTGCTGVDNAFILDRSAGSGDSSLIPAISMWSSTTGIKMDVQTNQQGLQVYT
jgi:aldose 1-epimerase